MTTKAIDLLSADRDGYFLMVEGGKIDHHNHANHARGALTETVALADAVAAALRKVDLRNTLVIVTADHSHGLVINGYAPRNAPILGKAGDEDAGRPPYTTLTYATGPGGPAAGRQARRRHDGDRLSPGRDRAPAQRRPQRRGCRHLRRRAPGAPAGGRGGAELHLSRHAPRHGAVAVSAYRYTETQALLGSASPLRVDMARSAPVSAALTS
jgi:hypothetical protein